MISISALALLFVATSASPFNVKPTQSDSSLKTNYMAKVMSKAHPLKPIRRLDEEEEEIDLSGYSLKYVKCQFVKSYDDELAENEEADTILATNRFIIFRLCPSSSCNYNYGEYLIDMADYLEAAVEYEQEQQEEMCDYCEEVCAADDDAADDGGRRRLSQEISCDSCQDECEKIADMEDNGYIEASNYIECQMIYEDDDDGGAEYYAGAMCASSGEKIKIGVFLDEECSQLDNSLSVEDYIDAKLSHAILKSIYNPDTSVPCVKPDWEVEEEDENADDANQEEEEEVEVNEMCQQLYEGAAKCEQKHGFENGVSNYDADSNQANQESTVCQFINTLSSGAYDQSGEIVLRSNAAVEDGARATTGGQKVSLTLFIFGTVGLAIYAAQIHSQLTKGVSAGLNTQGGAMA